MSHTETGEGSIEAGSWELEVGDLALLHGFELPAPSFHPIPQIRVLLSLAFLMLTALGASAQDVIQFTTTGGQVYSSSSVRRSGSTIFLKIPDAQGSGVVELGLPVSQITKIDSPVPTELEIALAAAKAGDASGVIFETETNIITGAEFKDLPGSWWPEAARIRLLALASSGRDADASALAGTIGVLNTPAAESLARGGALFGTLASADTEAVVVGAKAIPRLSGEPGAALAQLALGRALLFKKDYTGALRSFLTIKVFYPSLTLLQPPALLGAAQAYLGLDDEKRALQSVVELQDDYPRSSQAAEAKKIEKNLSKS